MAIRKAEKRQAKLRLALCGPTGSGKTYSALAIATGLGGRIGVIDTERNSACLYSDKFTFDVEAEMQTFAPGAYVEKIREFAEAGYDVLVIDSLSHAWNGEGGALAMVDEAAKRARGGNGNSFAAWRDVTPHHNRMVEAILSYPGHVVVTMRSKMEYVLEDGPGGKKVPRKVGMAPVQRDGLEYEFTVVGDMDTDHNLIVTKSRCSALADKVINRPGADMAKTLVAWLNDGAPAETFATPGEVEEFSIKLGELLESRGFDGAGWKRVIDYACDREGVKTLAEFKPERRAALLTAVSAGKFDKLKGSVAA